MNTLTTVLSVIHLVVCIVLIVVIMLQPSKSNGLSGAISGGSSDSFYGKNKGKTLEAKLEKATSFIAIAFIILTLLLYLL